MREPIAILTTLAVSVSLLLTRSSLAGPVPGQNSNGVRAQTAAAVDINELWADPGEGRDLFYGPGGRATMPDANGQFTFVARDVTGHSRGYDVRDAQGTLWSVKLGDEAQSEVVTSRLLWGMGFHQPAQSYVRGWRLSGAQAGPQPAGRFRPELPGLRKVADWSWYENPFTGTRQFHGLIVANILLTNWDWKTSNNKIYEVSPPRDGVGRWYVVRDVGASLGRTRFSSALFVVFPFFPFGTRNDLAGFEQQQFINRIDDGRIDFDYRSGHGRLVRDVASADVRWTCELAERLTDSQMMDAFRAGGYDVTRARRYVDKLRSNIARGLRMTAAAPSPTGSSKEPL